MFRVLPGVLWRAEGGGALVYDRQGDAVFDGNRPALLVLERLDGRATIGDIASELTRCFTITPEAALADVAAFVAEMCELGLAERLS